jgi:hypothetical protein
MHFHVHDNSFQTCIINSAFELFYEFIQTNNMFHWRHKYLSYKQVEFRLQLALYEYKTVAYISALYIL